MCEGYGYGGRLEEIRSAYGNMPLAYLDNAGAPLFPHTLPKRGAEALCSQPLMNPHSHAPHTSQIIAETRRQVLNMLHCDASEFDVVFCANATAAAKLVGEALYNYDYAYLHDSHTSLVGLREVSRSARMCGTLEELSNHAANSVVSWPLQSNFDGRRYLESEQVIKEIHDKQGLVLLDVASYAATEAPNLGRLKPDFAVLSFYKIYGLPDLGALIVRNTSGVREFFSYKRYFGGGTVAALAPGERFVARKQTLVDILEDGTVPFHSILMLQVAVQEFDRLYGSTANIARHTKLVAHYCKTRLQQIPGCTVYAPSDSPIVSFVLASIGHNELCTAAALHGVYVRAGTLCNIGGFMAVSSMSDSTIIRNYKTMGKTCNDEISFINGEATGVVRASFGPYSSYEDVDALLHVISSITRTGTTTGPALVPPELEPEPEKTAVRISALYTYPIKSCSGISVHTTLLGPQGLQYDREFCLLDLSSNKVLSLKNHRSMASLKPTIDAAHLTVCCDKVRAPNTISIPYAYESWTSSAVRGMFVVNTDTVVVDFFTRAVGIPCTIAKQSRQVDRTTDSAALLKRTESSLANSSPLLLVTLRSARALELVDVSVFRPNIVVEAKHPWAEDAWSTLSFPQADIQMLGKCRRCNMVTVTASGESDSRPYMQLCKYRKQDGKIYFGQHAKLASGDHHLPAVLSVGDTAIEI